MSTENRSVESVLCVTFQAPKTYFKIPADWDLKEIEVQWGILYYKGVKQDIEGVESELDCKRPVEMDIFADDEAEEYYDMFD